MTPLKVRYKRTATLVPYANNSRTHSAEQIEAIAKSIKEFGWTVPVLVDGDNGIIAGHARVIAAQQLGIEKVPTIELAHLSPEQKRAYIIADNKLPELAGWDSKVLGDELAALSEAGFDLPVIGFSNDELARLLGDPAAPPPSGEPGGGSGSFVYREKFAVLIECADEDEQKEIYDRLTGEGYNCRVLVN